MEKRYIDTLNWRVHDLEMRNNRDIENIKRHSLQQFSQLCDLGHSRYSITDKAKQEELNQIIAKRNNEINEIKELIKKKELKLAEQDK